TFQLAYAAGLLLVGRLIDLVGTRLGYAISIVAWSLASMAHGAASSMQGFLAVRFALGFGEAGVFPASIKAVAEWFPKKERAMATGIFNAGTNLGAILAPLVVPWLTLKYGWPAAFVATGAIGLVWIVLWLAVYRTPEKHTTVTAAELAYIRSDPGESAVPIQGRQLIRHRQM